MAGVAASSLLCQLIVSSLQMRQYFPFTVLAERQEVAQYKALPCMTHVHSNTAELNGVLGGFVKTVRECQGESQ